MRKVNRELKRRERKRGGSAVGRNKKKWKEGRETERKERGREEEQEGRINGKEEIRDGGRLQ